MKNRVLSGMQPTGYMHLGNYIGALKNWINLQNTDYDLFYMIADLHSLTSNQENYKTETVNYIENMVVDWIALGINPDRSVIFLQSDVPEHAELYTILSMITPIGWLERNPTYKEKMEEIKGKDLDNLGFLGYPVLQTADIALYRANLVPVGKDQIPHLEISREVIRRFNFIYKTDVLIEPQPLLSEVSKLNGIDGKKMSKSYGNCIYLKDDVENIKKKIMSMVTDVKRAYKKDPGHPDECNLFPYYIAFCKDNDFLNNIKNKCLNAEIGCIEDKKLLAEKLLDYFSDYRKKRENILNNKGFINDVLAEGAKKAREEAKKTMELVREAIGMKIVNRY